MRAGKSSLFFKRLALRLRLFNRSRKLLAPQEGLSAMQWKIGDVTVTKIVEIESVGRTKFILPQATPEEIQKLS
jgi:hypothetical protein